ncbi:MAG: leucyl/phenylalanyl-tRNA--protein transferase [Deltaproteobacteria bacterium]|nr:leucyl/phenylalanyl-tRNA--protein transferase [Deltaproteobacteria bacterium]
MSTEVQDIVAVGGDLRPETLLSAYRQGVFPWPHDGLPLLWYCPRERAVLDIEDVHVGRNLGRAARRNGLRFTIDQAFGRVIRACAAIPRPDQDGTWINEEMISAYERLHELGHAHSIEAWQEDRLVGGLYGVDPGGAFCGESMFYEEPNASHLALLHLLDHLKSRGLEWIDIQVMTPHMEQLGARAIPREDFLERLEAALERGLRLF